MDANPNVRPPGSSVPKPPTYAGPVKQVLHLILSAAGWVIFVYWWGIVLRSVSRQMVVVTALFLLGSLILVVGVTVAWSWHNKRLHERKGPRKHLREVTEDYGLDYVGRLVTFVGSRDQMLSAAEIDVSFDDDGKTYRAVASSPASAAAVPGDVRGPRRNEDPA